MSARSKSEAVRVIVALYRQFERATRDEDMSLTHYRTLLYLSTGPKRAGAIAAEAAVKKPTVSATLNVLRHKGWVEDRADPADGRVTQVVLTSAGQARIKAFEATLAKRIEAVLPG